MNSSSQCETLFNDVNDLGSGVAAIGHLLRSSQEEAYPFVLDGIGAVLHHLGKTMQGLNTQFINGTYQNIRAMEAKDEQAAAQARLLDDAKVTNQPVNAANTGETRTSELASEH